MCVKKCPCPKYHFFPKPSHEIRELVVFINENRRGMVNSHLQILLGICRYGNRTGCNVENVWKGMNYGGICNLEII